MKAEALPGPFSRLGRVPRSAVLPKGALALGIAAVLALASCGGEDAQLLPGGTAREITANLDTVKQLAAEGDCGGAESAAVQVSEQVEALGGVDEKLKRMLREGAARLNEVVADCEEEAEAGSQPTGGVEAEETERAKADGDRAEKDAEKAEKEREKELEKAEKELEKEEAEEEGDQPTPPGEREEGAGGEEEAVPPPSGGVSPAAPAGEGE